MSLFLYFENQKPYKQSEFRKSFR